MDRCSGGAASAIRICGGHRRIGGQERCARQADRAASMSSCGTVGRADRNRDSSSQITAEARRCTSLLPARWILTGEDFSRLREACASAGSQRCAAGCRSIAYASRDTDTRERCTGRIEGKDDGSVWTAFHSRGGAGRSRPARTARSPDRRFSGHRPRNSTSTGCSRCCCRRHFTRAGKLPRIYSNHRSSSRIGWQLQDDETRSSVARRRSPVR